MGDVRQPHDAIGSRVFALKQFSKYQIAGSFFAAYLGLFFLLSYPAGFSCFSAFLGDSGDGFQNAWNVWWVEQALFRLHVDPLYTRYLFFPKGVSLLGHTLSLTNTAPSAVLALAIGVVRAYNVWLILGFALAGLFTAFLFLEIGTSLLGAFVAGFAYTFSEYHFAHALGHFQLVAVQWIPLFLWAWLRLLDQPSPKRGVLAGLALVLVFYADYYYMLFGVLSGAVLLAGRLAADRALLRNRRLGLSMALFVIVVGAAAGPTAWRTAAFLKEPLTGVHNPFEFEVDALAPFVPGHFWRFGEWTKPIWKAFRTPPVEGCAYFGWAAIVLAAAGVTARRRALGWKVWSLIFAGAIFVLLSLGPEMRVDGITIRGVWGPYHHLETLLPLLRSGGVPGRMALISILSIAVLAGLGVEALQARARFGLLAALLALGFFEAIPAKMTTTPLAVPRFFEAMRNLPRGYAVLDIDSSLGAPARMYAQTGFELPTSGGYVSREPATVTRREARIQAMAAQGDFQHLCQDLGFRYVLVSSSRPLPGRSPILEGDGFLLFDLEPGWVCQLADLR